MFFASITVHAQLPEEYTNSVYDEVKHPYPLFDSLGVVSKETYYYKVGDMEYEYYGLFEEPKKDSALIFSYYYDTLQNKVTTLSGVEFEEDFLTEYYLSDSNQVNKIKYTELSYVQKRFLRRNKRKEWYGIKDYIRDEKGAIKSSKHTHYRESWKEWRKKGRRKAYKIDSSSFKETFYNSLGLIDSSHKIMLKYFSSDTSVIETVNFEYTDSGRLNRKVKTYSERDWSYPNQQYGIYWWLNIKTKKHKIRVPFNWDYTQERDFRYHKNGKLRAIHTQVDSGAVSSKIFKYTNFDSLASISSVYDNDTTVEERLEYDSLNRISYHFKTAKSNHDHVADPRIICKLFTGLSSTKTQTYYYDPDGSYTKVTESDGGSIITTTYYNTQGVLVKRCFSLDYCNTYIYNKNQNVIQIVSSDSTFTKFKYNQFGLQIEKRTPSYDCPENSIIRTFYKFSN